MPARPVLRPYQVRAVEQLRARVRAGERRIVLVAPCGAGKTIVACELIHAATERGNRVVVIAHRKELIDQTVDKLSMFAVPAGVVMAADARFDPYHQTQVCSIQTLARRITALPPAQVVVVDECHHVLSRTYRTVLDAYPRAVVLGLTATPWRHDRKGLADMFSSSVLVATPAELMAEGSLVNYQAFAYDAPDLHAVPLVAGEYNQEQLGLACNTKTLVGDIVKEYLAHARGRRAIVFPVNIAHSKAIVDEFRAASVRAEHVDHKSSREQRAGALDGLGTGAVTVVASVGVVTEGFDQPAVEVAILARPTQSLSLHVQMIGRCLRPSPATGKRDALIHDHSGNLLRHGLIEEERDYSLTATPARDVALNTCPMCGAVFGRVRADGTCPGCGQPIVPVEHRPEDSDGPKRREVVTVDGVRIDKDTILRLRAERAEAGLDVGRRLSDEDVIRAARATREEKLAEYARLLRVAEKNGFKKGFAAWQYRHAFGVWPQWHERDLDDVVPASAPFLHLPRRRTG